MDEFQNLSHTVWECKYHVVFIPKYRRKVLYGELRRSLVPHGTYAARTGVNVRGHAPAGCASVGMTSSSRSRCPAAMARSPSSVT